MRPCQLLVTAVLTIALTACQPAEQGADAPQAKTHIVRAEFGLFNEQENGKLEFIPSKSVPLSVGQVYGWVVVLKAPETKVRWREEFILPAAPASWKPQSSVVQDFLQNLQDFLQNFSQDFSQDRTTAVTEREVKPIRGAIFNRWKVVEGDPRGKYVIRLTVEESDPIVFEFQVE